MRNPTIPATLNGARRAWRKRMRRLIRREAQLRRAQADAARNLHIGVASRDRNVKLALRGHELMLDTRKTRERIIAQSIRRIRARERGVLVVLGTSLALLAWSAWKVLQ